MTDDRLLLTVQLDAFYIHVTVQRNRFIFE
jgi:hypothetical protein